MAMADFLVDSVAESVFTLKLRRILFVVKFQAFTMNSNDRICDRVCF